MAVNYSFIVSFRDRDIQRVKNSLESISKQFYKSFELIFIDYGSKKEIANEIKQVVESYSFATYIYSETTGWYWNRAHALNTGIKISKGNVLVLSDIDLIFSTDFTSKLNQLFFADKFYTFSCYYLPEYLKSVTVTDEVVSKSRQGYVGLCAVLKEHLIAISGFDEYYMNWGGEDDDLYNRLTTIGLEWEKPSVNDFPVIHQWHQVQAPRYPTSWYLEMVQRLYSGNIKNINSITSFGNTISYDERPIAKKLEQYRSFKKLELFPNPTFQFNLFLDSFFKMDSGEYGYIELVLPSEVPKGRKERFIENINLFLAKQKFPYKINKCQSRPLPIHDKQLWSDFIMYFIGKNRNVIFDYYILETSNALTLILKKK